MWSKDTSDIILALATVALAIATGLLWLATFRLAKSAKEDLRKKKMQDTASAWVEVRKDIPIGGLDKLTKASVLTEDQRTQLWKMEYFAAGINRDVYDLDVFDSMSGGWFLQQYKRIEPYIKSRSNPKAYSELKALQPKISATHHDVAED